MDVPILRSAPDWFRARSPCRSPTARRGRRRADPLPGLGRAGAAGWCSCTAAARTPTGGPTSPPRSPTSSGCSPIDLSGHGDSDHRDELHARAVDRRGDGRRRGRRHRRAAGDRSATAWAGSSPSPPRRSTPTDVARRHRVRLAGHRARPRDRVLPAAGGLRRAPHLRDASTRPLARFRTVPAQDALPRLRHRPRRPGGRCTPVDGGWQWKFDRRIFEQFAAGMRGVAPAVPARRALPPRAAALRVRPGHRRHRRRRCTSSSAGSRRSSRSPRPATTPCSTSPCILLTALRTLLADWDQWRSKGKKAVIVGGASGMARASAELLQRAGRIGRDPRPARRRPAPRSPKALGGTFHPVDVTDDDERRAGAERRGRGARRAPHRGQHRGRRHRRAHADARTVRTRSTSSGG